MPSFDEKDKPAPTLPTAESFEDDKISHDHDDRNSIIEGSDNVTREEFDTLRHIGDKLPSAAWLVVFVEFAERWTYFGTTNVFNNYIRAKLPRGSTNGAVVNAIDRAGNGVAGALGKGQQTSYAIRTFNTFFVYVTPILGAIIADVKWGRYKTIMVFSLICLVGHIILVGSASPQVLQHPDTAMGLLVFSILIIGVGAGCIKSNVAPMLGEQYQGKLRKVTLGTGETVIMSPAVTLQSVYLCAYFYQVFSNQRNINFVESGFYASINLGACGAISASFVARDHGFWVAWLIPTGIFCLVPGVLLIGKKYYVKTAPRGSVLLETIRVIRMAMAPAWSINPVNTIRAIKAPTFWNPAKPSYYSNESLPASITWDDAFVGEVARTCNACAVFLFFPFYWLCYSQIDGNLSTVTAGMTLRGTPNDLIGNLNPIAIIIMVPLFDYVIYPMLRRRGINFTPIKRIYAGFLVAGLAMLYSAILQHYIYLTLPCHDNIPSECVTTDDAPWPSPLNAWIVAGPYILVAISEIFASVTSIEYAFTKAPTRMKSVVMAFSSFQSALSSLLNFALVPVSTEDKFAWLFGSFGVVAVVIGTIFFLVFRDLDRKEAELNAIGSGKREGFVDEIPEMMKPQHDKAII
ncbi:peptide transporter PTR2B [Crepidotus variabilis]|uniref:Peptide transporter PTR2B n=1 Tax=Crepidotus variabilis TaxID=179855 RepID=A0A9P6ELT2_9AGAR|nr:peptide transporter PTR2B [Crepidotus variabilis]